MGFVVLFKVRLTPLQPGDAKPKGGPSPEPKLGVRCPGRLPWRQAAAVSGHWNPSVGSPCLPVAVATGRTDDAGGRSRIPLRRLFSAGAGAPRRALDSSCGRSRAR
jgi:hypothetical protein